MDREFDLEFDLGVVPEELAMTLFNAWLVKLSTEQLGYTQHGSGGDQTPRDVTFGSPIEGHFVLRESGRHVAVGEIVGTEEADVGALLDSARRKVAERDYGDGVVYRAEMTLQTFDFLSDGMHFMRTLGDQVHIEGRRRLCDLVLLDFQEGLLAAAPEAGLLLAPPSTIQVTIFAPGPCHSDLSLRVAAGIAEIVAAICALATGRPVTYTSLMFPADDEVSSEARTHRHDPSILGLARDSISLDVFGDLGAIGGVDAQLRMRGALLAYHAALKQSSADVAVMLFVTSIEALLSPRQSWGKQKVTQRFVKALIGLCPAAVDAVIAHGNVQQAFGYERRGGARHQCRDLLNLIYESRSLPTHAGLSLPSSGLAFMASAESMRVALLSDLARAAILAFLQAPRSSLVGHPQVDPPGDGR